MTATRTLQMLSITSALLSAGSIATLSLFDIPIIKSQPASRSLPMLRWLFSRGSHIYPTQCVLTSSGFASLAYTCLPATATTLPIILSHAIKGKTGMYLAAALLTLSIGPWTTLVMLPTNFELIQRNEDLGGTRSQKSAEYRERTGQGKRNIEESTGGEGDVSQWTDLSGPQEKTARESSEKDDREVRQLMDKFAVLNCVRAVLMGVGGVVGLVAALG
jgi:hypothetical protein